MSQRDLGLVARVQDALVWFPWLVEQQTFVLFVKISLDCPGFHLDHSLLLQEDVRRRRWPCTDLLPAQSSWFRLLPAARPIAQ